MLGMGADYQIAGTEGDLIIYPISTYMPLDPSYIAVFTTEVPVGELRDPQVQLDLLTTIWSVRFSPPLDTVYRSEGYLPFAYSSSYTLNDVTYYPILTFYTDWKRQRFNPMLPNQGMLGLSNLNLMGRGVFDPNNFSISVANYVRATNSRDQATRLGTPQFFRVPLGDTLVDVAWVPSTFQMEGGSPSDGGYWIRPDGWATDYSGEPSFRYELSALNILLSLNNEEMLAAIEAGE